MSSWLKIEHGIIKLESVSAFSYGGTAGAYAFLLGGKEDDGWLISKKNASDEDREALRSGIESLIEWNTEGWFPAGMEIAEDHPFRAPIITVEQLIEIGRSALAPK